MNTTYAPTHTTPNKPEGLQGLKKDLEDRLEGFGTTTNSQTVAKSYIDNLKKGIDSISKDIEAFKKEGGNLIDAFEDLKSQVDTQVKRFEDLLMPGGVKALKDKIAEVDEVIAKAAQALCEMKKPLNSESESEKAVRELGEQLAKKQLLLDALSVKSIKERMADTQKRLKEIDSIVGHEVSDHGKAYFLCNAAKDRLGKTGDYDFSMPTQEGYEKTLVKLFEDWQESSQKQLSVKLELDLTKAKAESKAKELATLRNKRQENILASLEDK